MLILLPLIWQIRIMLPLLPYNQAGPSQYTQVIVGTLNECASKYMKSAYIALVHILHILQSATMRENG